MIGCVAPVSVLLTCLHVYVFEDLFILYPYAAVMVGAWVGSVSSPSFAAKRNAPILTASN